MNNYKITSRLKKMSKTSEIFILFNTTLLNLYDLQFISSKTQIEKKEIDRRLREIAEESSKEKSYGYFSLFHSRALCLRTFCVTMAFTASAFVYYQVLVSILIQQLESASNSFKQTFLIKE